MHERTWQVLVCPQGFPNLPWTLLLKVRVLNVSTRKLLVSTRFLAQFPGARVDSKEVPCLYGPLPCHGLLLLWFIVIIHVFLGSCCEASTVMRVNITESVMKILAAWDLHCPKSLEIFGFGHRIQIAKSQDPQRCGALVLPSHICVCWEEFSYIIATSCNHRCCCLQISHQHVGFPPRGTTGYLWPPVLLPCWRPQIYLVPHGGREGGHGDAGIGVLCIMDHDIPSAGVSSIWNPSLNVVKICHGLLPLYAGLVIIY